MKQRYKEFVAAFVGPRGGAKTANMVLWGIDAMVNDMPCHSNQPICSPNGSPLKVWLPDGTYKMVRSVDLDYPAFLQNPTKFFQVFTLIDEIQLMANSLRTMSNGNLLLQEISTQIRKQEMSMGYTVQEFAWVDSRFSFQTDVLVECTDMAFTPWGMEEGLGIGELSQCIYKDLTGIYTGRPYSKYYEAHIFTVPIKEVVWDTYDTRKMIDPSQGRKKYVFDKEEVHLKQGPDGEYVATEYNPNDVRLRMQSLVNQMAAGGYQEVSTADFWKMCSEAGIEGNYRQLGLIAKQFGLERQQRYKGDWYLFPTHPKHSINRQEVTA